MHPLFIGEERWSQGGQPRGTMTVRRENEEGIGHPFPHWQSSKPTLASGREKNSANFFENGPESHVLDRPTPPERSLQLHQRMSLNPEDIKPPVPEDVTGDTFRMKWVLAAPAGLSSVVLLQSLWLCTWSGREQTKQPSSLFTSTAGLCLLCKLPTGVGSHDVFVLLFKKRNKFIFILIVNVDTHMLHNVLAKTTL